MAKDTCDSRITVEQTPFPIPDLTIKDLLSVIPAHCHKRSAIRSMSYVVYDFFLIFCIYKLAVFLDARISPEFISLPSPYLYSFARFVLWSLYGFANGLVATGLWVLAHECGHQAFSESKALNNAIGWVLHSGLGVPYHSWRITHAKHHASTGHMTQDQVFIPKTRSQLGLPAFDAAKEDLYGASVNGEVQRELWEAMGDSPIGAALGAASYLLFGWWLYIGMNASGQKNYPSNTNHFNPSAMMFAPHHRDQILISDLGIVIWLAAVITAIYHYGFLEVFRVYLVPYLWVNHWLVLITFLQHTDPLLPHYRAPEFTFPRGALTTLDRNLLGDCGSIMGWLGAHLTHGISETHVAHHVASKIPHYHAWEANDILHARLRQAGLVPLKGRPGGWAEMYRVFKECKFVEDEGNIIFYKNAHGLASTRPVVIDSNVSDSGIEFDKDA
ncbi:delta12-fatty acid desaturase [Laetiporus sulphureus 93-53]|uniref:Delta12-fatty acid desaturase n=1 Tax=Laetiporus sulphureus 93-53 TaxID=1314785 RepID=A0A165HJZ9_9APHY|nr:delta12-fatty acid desaturase [Laetiporus sulphureus 93-53]KZT11828.1 delta12-fatty acid desaturase [Laetiporus sulphureus 93-53]